MPELTPAVIMIAFMYYVVFLFSTTCHEAAHAFVASRGGDATAALGGQVTLNPIPHIRREPFGMVLVPLIALFTSGNMIGWASAPYDPLWERRHPHRAALMALAGPAANFSLMFLAAILLRVGMATQYFSFQSTSSLAEFVFALLKIVFRLNLLLGIFNLLPVPPLDGSAGIMIFMDETRAQSYLDWLRGNSFAIAGLLVGLIVFRQIFPPIQLCDPHSGRTVLSAQRSRPRSRYNSTLGFCAFSKQSLVNLF